MRPELETYQLIDNYLNGRMTSTEKESFESRLNSEPDLADELTFQKMVNKVVQGAAYENLRSKMTADLRKIDRREDWKRYLLPGSFLAVLSVLWFGNIQNSDKSENALPAVIQSPIQTPAKNEVIISQESPEKIEVKAKKSPDKVKRNVADKVLAQTSASTIDSTKSLKTIITTPEVQKEAALPIAEEEKQKGVPAVKLTHHVCESVIFTGKPTVSPACEGKSDGSAKHLESLIQHAAQPYKLQLRETGQIAEHGKIQHLAGGTYTVVLTDANRCERELSITIPEINCIPSNYVINPDIGDIWKYETPESAKGISVYNKEGKLVWQNTFSESHHQLEWNGTDLHNVTLPAGLYIYIVEYIDGRKVNGQITLLK